MHQDPTAALFQAVMACNTSATHEALSAGADPNGRDEWRQTPLHWAAIHGVADIAALLTSSGADPNAQDDQLYTPLHWAAGSGDAELTRLFLEQGGNPRALDIRHQTPIHWAAERNHSSVVAMMQAGR